MAERFTHSELEQREKTAQCAEFILSQTPFMVDFDPDVSFGIKFIDGVVEKNGLLEVPGVSERVSNAIKKVILQNGLEGLTEERISELSNDYQRQRMLMGENLRDKAQKTESLLSMSTEDATSHFGQALADYLVSAKTDGWTGYKYQEVRDQEAVQTQERSIIVIPQQKSGESDQLDVIDLDQLNKQDPVFVKEFVIRLCKLQILGNSIDKIIGLVKDNYSYHELDEQPILPELLQELSVDPQTAVKEGNDLLAFLRIHLQIEPDYRPEAKRVIDAYNTSHDTLRNVRLYLNHIMSCKAEVELRRQRASVLIQAHDLMSRPVAYFQREGEAQIIDKDRFQANVDLIKSSGSYLSIVIEHVKAETEAVR